MVTITFHKRLLTASRKVVVVQLQLLGLMIPKERGAVPMDAATRAGLIDLMARVLVAVFHEEGGSDNDRGPVQSQNQNRSTWLARRLSTCGNPAKNKYDRIRRANFSSMPWPNGCVRWAGSKSKSSTMTWDRARALPPPSGKASSVS